VTARQPVPPGQHQFAPAGLAGAADWWLRRFLGGVLGAMTLVTCAVGALAFYTSFEAIRAYAERSQGIAPQHAWVVPLLVDSFIVVATFADLWLSTRPRRSWLELAAPKALLAGAALVSFVLNIAHAEHADWAARGVAAIPPAALLLSVELVLMIVRRAVGARTIRLAAPAPAPAERGAAMQPAGSGGSDASQPTRHAPGRHQPPARRPAGQADGPRRRALAVLQHDPGISGGRLGRAVGMSERWGRNVRPVLVAELAATSGTSMGTPGGNGDGDHTTAAGVLALPAPAAGDGSDAPA
jgi:hypothetical protein